ncbi:MAG: 50S ribosomal protein L29 [Candidatus Hydrogenedentota bacterium]|nr:MAG: 50S ribosomal protein L29 [Candidatus Hydrogenedentota bacterium]
MKAQKLREMNDTELQQKLVDSHDDLMHFRLQMATGVVDNVRSAREIKKVVARIKTILNERSRAAQAGAGDKN